MESFHSSFLSKNNKMWVKGPYGEKPKTEKNAFESQEYNVENETKSSELLSPSARLKSNHVGMKASEGTCPLCWENNQISKLVPVFYKMHEGIYTCENINCIYFVSDRFGNLQKFKKSDPPPTSSQISDSHYQFGNPSGDMVLAKTEKFEISQQLETDRTSTSYLDDIFNCRSKDADLESILNELSTDLDNLINN